MEGEQQQLVGVFGFWTGKKNAEQVLVSMRAGAMVPSPDGRSSRLAKKGQSKQEPKEPKSEVSVHLGHVGIMTKKVGELFIKSERKTCREHISCYSLCLCNFFKAFLFLLEI